MKLPVLLMFFNREDCVLQVMKAIRKYRPPVLYLASDGPRSIPGEAEIVAKVRKAVLAMADWGCEAKTLFRDHNLNCDPAVVDAIDWFFAHEESGIILEDDCVPGQSLFRFAEDLIERYRDVKTIWGVGGLSASASAGSKCGYTFSGEIKTWGWATWRDRWQKARSDIEQIHSWDLGFLMERYINTFSFGEYVSKIREVRNGGMCWDWMLQLVVLRARGLWACSENNLVTNIGSDGTHTMDDQPVGISIAEFDEIVHPPEVPDYQELVGKNKYFGHGEEKLLTVREYKARYRETLWELIKMYPGYKLSTGLRKKTKKKELRRLRNRLRGLKSAQLYVRVKESANANAELQKIVESR